jgi:hypothetical protein
MLSGCHALPGKTGFADLAERIIDRALHKQVRAPQE